jgi:hypothetical protein
MMGAFVSGKQGHRVVPATHRYQELGGLLHERHIGDHDILPARSEQIHDAADTPFGCGTIAEPEGALAVRDQIVRTPHRKTEGV